MSSDLSNYMVPCMTEQVDVLSDYVYTVPTTCPNNIAHIIDASRILKYSTIKTKSVVIDQDSNLTTGGYYRVDYYDMNINPNSTYNLDITYPYNVNIYITKLFPTSSNVGDNIEILYAPNTQIDTLISVLNIGSSSLLLQSAVGLNPGFRLFIGSEDVGEIVTVDLQTNIITFTNPTTILHSIGEAVATSISVVRKFTINTTENLLLGVSKIKSLGLEANTILRVAYTNNQNASKLFSLLIELEY